MFKAFHSKKVFIFVFLLILVCGGVYFYKVSTFSIQKKDLTINNTKISVEIADTASKREIGLMNRATLPTDTGMLFIFPTESRYSFWMKNTLIPLDIIWISGDKKVVYIEKNVQPCKKVAPLLENCPVVTPSKNALYVLEVNAGWATENKVVVDDTVTLSNFIQF